MKKSIFTKIGAAAVALTLVTSSLVGGTFAKYTSTVSASGTASVARWAVAFKEGASNALNTGSAKVVLKNENTKAATNDGEIAPDSFGTIALMIDGTGSEVGYTYTVTANNGGLGTVPVAFYSDAERTQKINFTSNEAEVESGTVALDDVGTAKTVNIYWAWESADDATDTSLGETPIDGTVTLNITAEQLITK